MAGGLLAHDGSFEGRPNFETDESTNRQDFTGGYMNEIIAARWIILTDRFLACVCVGVCVCVCVY